MTATELLRRLLDECGVEYMKVDFIDGERITSFDANGREHGYHEFPDGETLLRVWHLTPAQAIAATLGVSTCEADETDTWECVRDDLGSYGKRLTVHVMECTECGHVYEHVNGDYEYCPRCGRKREDVSE
jgi:predicted Zn-ribbon and HTH transcriptional regulator